MTGWRWLREIPARIAVLGTLTRWALATEKQLDASQYVAPYAEHSRARRLALWALARLSTELLRVRAWSAGFIG